MYLISDLESSSTDAALTSIKPPKPQVEFGTPGGNSINNPASAWVRYTVIGACILLVFITLVFLYDLYSRYREYRDCRDQHIHDGGPPASPGHHHSYTFAVRADDASSTFDTKQTIIKIEALDSQNQYLTSVTVPCFLFKFKSAGRTPANYPTPPEHQSPAPSVSQQQAQSQQPQSQSQQQQQQQQQQPQQSSASQQVQINSTSTATSKAWHYRSLTQLQETWANTARSELITFYLIRRQPLQNLASLRIIHDCYLPNAILFLKYIVIRDDLSQQCVRVDLLDRPIRALPPAAPTGLQVYPAEPLLTHYQFEENKTFWHLMKRVCCGSRNQ